MNDEFSFREALEALEKNKDLPKIQEAPKEKRLSTAEVLQETNRTLRGIELLLGQLVKNSREYVTDSKDKEQVGMAFDRLFAGTTPEDIKF